MTQLTMNTSDLTNVNKKRPPRIKTSFTSYSNKEYIAKRPKFAQVIPLNQSKTAGFYISEEDVLKAKWLADESCFEKGSLIFGHKHKFGGQKAPGAGILLIQPRIQILTQSSPMLEHTFQVKGTKNKKKTEIIASLSASDYSEDNKYVCDQWWSIYNDKTGTLAQKAGLEGDLTVRNWYVGYVLTSTNDRAHEYPVVFSVKGITGAIFKEEIQDFRQEMSRTLACVNEVSPRDLTEEITGRYVWIPTFAFDTYGENGNEVVGVKEYVKPDYSSVENAEKSLDNLLIPDDMMVQTKKDQDDELLQNFCNRFSDQLNGDLGHYGYSKQLQSSRPIDPHVLPEGAADTGEDAAL